MQFAPSSASEYLQQCTHELARIDLSQIDRLVDDIYEAYLRQRFVFIIGNGGSASTASHFCEDLGKGTIPPGQRADSKRIRAISLTDNAPYLLAWGNDEGFECVFEEQLKNLASSGDCLIAISCSGNSPNVLRAVEWAKRQGVKSWGITGLTGGSLMTEADDNLHVPCLDMGLVESIHLLLFHWIVRALSEKIQKTGAAVRSPHYIDTQAELSSGH